MTIVRRSLVDLTAHTMAAEPFGHTSLPITDLRVRAVDHSPIHEIYIRLNLDNEDIGLVDVMFVVFMCQCNDTAIKRNDRSVYTVDVPQSRTMRSKNNLKSYANSRAHNGKQLWDQQLN